MERRIEIRIDQASFTYKFEHESLSSNKHEKRCRTLINSMIKGLGLDEVFVHSESVQGRNGYTDGIRFAVDNVEMVSFYYNNSIQNMGLFVEFKATGLEHYLATRGIGFPILVKELQGLIDKEENPGFWKMTRYDVAADIFNYGVNLNKINNKILKGTLKFKQLSKRGDTSKKRYIDKSLREEHIKHIGTGENIETLYIGTRQGKSSFLRFYNKYLDVISKGKKTEEECYSKDWYRYEIEMKFDKVSGKSLFDAVLEVDTDEDFKSFNARQIIDNYRLVTNKDNDIPFMAYIAKIAKNGEFGYISPNEARVFDLKKSKQYFISGKSGLQSLIYRIKMTEGEGAVLDFLNDIIDYQNEEYIPSERDNLYVRRFDRKG